MAVRRVEPVNKNVSKTKLDDSSLMETFLLAAQPVMSIDQAFDGTGISLVFVNFRLAKAERFITKTMPYFDEKYTPYTSSMLECFHEAVSAGGGPLIIHPENKRKRPFSFGFVWGPGNSVLDTCSKMILHGKITVNPSDEPEWRQAQLIANIIKKTADRFTKSVGMKPLVTVEGLALRGNVMTASILPCLGILYGAINGALICAGFETREVPISSWKKVLTSNARAKKPDIKQSLATLGFGRFASDDESDAVGMSISCHGMDPIFGKLTHGRIRPTKAESALAREKRKKKKEKKLSG